MGRSLRDYHAALDYLYRRTTGATRLGLDRTRALLAHVGDPHLRYRSVHVAGTNGKGSTVATLDALLRAKALRVARYTSPHLVDFRERVVVNGEAVPPEWVVEFIERWTPAIERIGATFFEATTVLAFDYFAAQRADIAVVETGLGGRLDATNVITPIAAGVTNVSVDHVEYLGETIGEIAAEKAGIFKDGVPAVVGEPDPKVRDLLVTAAHRAGSAPVVCTSDEWPISAIRVENSGTEFVLRRGGTDHTLRTPLAGRHQAANATTALALLDSMGKEYSLTPAQAAQRLPWVRLAGRLQHEGRYIFDVAHNPEGAAVLAGALAELAPRRPLTALICVLGDKDWRRMIDVLVGSVDGFVITDAPTVPSNRRWNALLAAGHARSRHQTVFLETDFDRALSRAEAEGATVLITGSFHTVGDAMVRLQLSPLDG